MAKKDILNLIIEKQEKLITDIEQSVNRYKSASDLDETDTIDPEDYSHQEEAKEMQLRLEERLKEERNDLEHLITFKDKTVNTIDHGALVETEKHYLYIGISSAPFSFNNKTIVCISKQAPILATMKNKTIGDMVTIGDEDYKIINIR